MLEESGVCWAAFLVLERRAAEHGREEVETKTPEALLVLTGSS